MDETTSRGRTVGRWLSGMGMSLAMTVAIAADFPTKPIRFLVGVAPGGGTDFMARLIGQAFTEAWGQPVVVDNRPGATGLIAMELTARAVPDGYTLIVFNVGHMMSAHLARRVEFDPVKDFAPVSLMASGTNMLGANPSLQVRSVKELVALAKAQPNKVSYASGGIGGIQHLGTELFQREAGIKLVHVPYKGSGPGTRALLAGEVPVFLTNMLALLPHVQSGKLHGLAVTGEKRAAAAPDVPTFAEVGYPNVDVSLWQGMFAPAGTPQAVIDKLSNAIAAAVKRPETVQLLARQGAEPAGLSAREFGAFVHAEREKWLRVVRDAGIKSGG